MKKKRLLAIVIDFCIIMLGIQVFVLISFFSQPYFMEVAFSIIFTLFLCKDNLNGQSLGKHLMRIQVVDNSTNQPPRTFILILRNFFLSVWPIELVLVLINGDRRLGDYVAKTSVIINAHNQSVRFRIRDLYILLICFVVVFAFTLLAIKLSTSVFPLIKLLF